MTWNRKVYAMRKRDSSEFWARAKTAALSTDSASVASTVLWSLYTWNLRTAPSIFNIEHNILSVIRHDRMEMPLVLAEKKANRFEFSNHSISIVSSRCKSRLHFIIIAKNTKEKQKPKLFSKPRYLVCDYLVRNLFKLTIYLNYHL